MIITKEEKKIYSFLDIVYMLFGKAVGRKVLFGYMDRLYFYCEGYAGCFRQEDYSFDPTCYSIGKTPDANYVLESERLLEMLEEESIERIDRLICHNSKYLEIAAKTEEYKIAKIVADTGFWLKDEDLKILTKYRFFMVKVPLDEDNMLLITEENTAYSSNILFNFDFTYTKPVTQLSFDTVDQEEEKPVVVISSKEQLDGLTANEEEKQLDELMTETVEETRVDDDDYDPMA